jgi:4-carboxymuconolactone decarboxylase
MSERLPRLTLADLDADQYALHSELTGGPRAGPDALFPLSDATGRLLGPFEATAHERVARAAGLTEEDLEAARSGRPPRAGNALETAAVQAADALLRRGDVSDAEYADLSGALPPPLLFEVVCLVGYYTTLAWTMRAFRSDHPLPPS